MSNMIAVKDLKYSYSEGSQINFPDLHCAAGEAKLILGSSGVGKTTLLHLIGGILRIQQGSVTISGQDIASLSASSLDAFRGKHIGVIFQQSHFIRALSLMDNLRMTRRLSGLPTDDDHILGLLKTLRIDHKATSMTQNMSVGERQRAAIARALSVSPSLILADEPTSALDDDNCDEVISLIKKSASDAQAALLIVTHDNRLKSTFPDQIILQ